MTDTKPLAGKIAVVTGAGRGIGRSIAITFARAGADIAICSRTADELESTRGVVEELGVRCIAGAKDLTDPEATEKFCSEVLAQFGRVDVLVNNAGGLLESGKIAESDPMLWWKTIEINVRAPFNVTRFLLNGLADGAKVINLSSGLGWRPGESMSAYHVAKAALNMLTGALANELWPRNIDVNNLIPGPAATSAFDQGNEGRPSTPEEILARFSDQAPSFLPRWERMKHPDEVAELALFMATMPDRGPTGQTFSLARRPL